MPNVRLATQTVLESSLLVLQLIPRLHMSAMAWAGPKVIVRMVMHMAMNLLKHAAQSRECNAKVTSAQGMAGKV